MPPRRPRSGTEPDQKRYAMLDLGYAPGKDFCRELLITPDFNLSTLAQFAKGENKSAAATAIAERIEQGELDPEELMLAYCRQPRQWLCIKTGSVPKTMPEYGSAEDFLTKFGPRKAWYGPFIDEERTWYVHASKEKHYIQQEEGTPVAQPIRWHVVAEVHPRYVALHWNNFTHNALVGEPDDRRMALVQFPYWYEIPEILGGIVGELGASLSFKPPLQRIVLHTLMNKFEGEDGFTWKHLRIRAERDGVALNAHSAGARDINVRGLQALTRAVAHAIARLLPVTAPHESKMERSVLRTFIHEWGTKSYEFSLDEGEDYKFHAHCYFGTNLNLNVDGEENEDEDEDDEGDRSPEWRSHGPDDFPHLKCFQTYGGSMGARDFLLPYLLK